MRRMIPVIPVIAAVIVLVVLIIIFAGGGSGSSNHGDTTSAAGPSIPPEIDQTINLVGQDDGYAQTLGNRQTAAKGIEFARDALTSPGKVGMTKRGAESLGVLVTQDKATAQKAQRRTGRVRTGVTTLVGQESVIGQKGNTLQVAATIQQQWKVRGSSRADTSNTPLAFEFQQSGGTYLLTGIARIRSSQRKG